MQSAQCLGWPHVFWGSLNAARNFVSCYYKRSPQLWNSIRSQGGFHNKSENSTQWRENFQQPWALPLPTAPRGLSPGTEEAAGSEGGHPGAHTQRLARTQSDARPEKQMQGLRQTFHLHSRVLGSIFTCSGYVFFLVVLHLHLRKIKIWKPRLRELRHWGVVIG